MSWRNIMTWPLEAHNELAAPLQTICPLLFTWLAIVVEKRICRGTPRLATCITRTHFERQMEFGLIRREHEMENRTNDARYRCEILYDNQAIKSKTITLLQEFELGTFKSNNSWNKLIFFHYQKLLHSSRKLHAFYRQKNGIRNLTYPPNELINKL